MNEPSPQRVPRPKPRLFLSELLGQLEVIKERLRETLNLRPDDPKEKEKLRAYKQSLRDRLKVVQQRIIDYDPPEE